MEVTIPLGSIISAAKEALVTNFNAFTSLFSDIYNVIACVLYGKAFLRGNFLS